MSVGFWFLLVLMFNALIFWSLFGTPKNSDHNDDIQNVLDYVKFTTMISAAYNIMSSVFLICRESPLFVAAFVPGSMGVVAKWCRVFIQFPSGVLTNYPSLMGYVILSSLFYWTLFCISVYYLILFVQRMYRDHRQEQQNQSITQVSLWDQNWESIIINTKPREESEENQEENQEVQNCIICLDLLERNNGVRVLKCTHGFHSSCIENWFNRNPSCPVCRKTLQELRELVVVESSGSEPSVFNHL